VSIAGIRDGLMALLSASGPWAASEISACAFDVLEQSSGCAIVLMPGPTSTIEPYRMGNPRGYLRRWGMQGTVYIKDNGDPTLLLSKLWQAHDDLYSTISKDDTLQASACAAALTGVSYRKGDFEEVAGALWATVDFTIEADEF